MKYRYPTVEPFWKHFFRLSAAPNDAARRALPIFKQNPFDPQLRPHKIYRLSARYGRAIFAVEIEGDLRTCLLCRW